MKEQFEFVQRLVFVLASAVALNDKKQVRAITKALSKEFGIDFDAIVKAAA